MDKMLTVRDVADLCRVQEDTVRLWHRKGVLPRAVKLGRKLLWPQESLVQALKEARLDG